MTQLPVTVVSDAREIWGSERSVLNLVPHLRERGIELSLAAPHGAFADAARALGVRHVVWQPGERGGERTRPLVDLLRDARSVPAGVARIARATRGAAVVHSNNLLVHPDAAVAGRLTRRPTVIELHDLVRPGAPQRLLAATAALSSAVVAISAAVAGTIAGRGRTKVRLITQAVDLDRFSPGRGDAALRTTLGGPGTLVGIVGRVDPEKGVAGLVRAVAASGDDVRLVVIGEPSASNHPYLQHILTLGAEQLGERFRYAGVVEDVPATLRCLDIVANASDAEPFGLSVLEAQACGVPVVATDAGGIPDFVADGRTGLLVPPGDVSALADALRRLSGDETLQRRLAAAALEQARAHHGLASRADALATLYRSLRRTP